MATIYVHPLYVAMLPLWKKMRDCYAGEEVIKDAGEAYLPPTSGMRLDGYGKGSSQPGQKAYDAYKLRAVFPEVVEDAIHSSIGVMHGKQATIEVPDVLKELLNRATDTGEDLQMLLRKINTMQLIAGRLALLGDIRQVEGKAVPTIVVYNEASAVNWDDVLVDQDSSELRFVILDESGFELKDSFQWEFVERYKVLALVTADGKFANAGETVAGVGFAEMSKDQNPKDLVYTLMSVQGSVVEKVPVVFCNAMDLSSVPGRPPFLGLANTALAIYRGEADYRQNLFMQGQDTLVILGDARADTEETTRTGAGSSIRLPINGDAKYIGVNSQGLPEQRQALDGDYKRASAKSSKLMTESGQESGEALRVRVSAKTATLNQIAITGAAALQEVLRRLAVMFGANPDEVRVTPNLEFAKVTGDGNNLRGLVEAKGMGAPISDKSIHGWAKEQGFTSMTYEEELAALGSEEPLVKVEPGV